MTVRTLVTGATGFVGSHVAAAFAEAGQDVRCTVRKTSDLRWIRDLDVETVEADLRDREAVRRALDGVDQVVHLAAVTRAPRNRIYHEVNVDGTVRLADVAMETGVRRFVFVSSLAARGPDGEEEPTSEYGASKYLAEQCLRHFTQYIDVVVLRPGGVYGPRDEDMVPLFRMASRGWVPVPSGAGQLQPIFVEDVARAVVQAGDPDGEAGFGPHPLVERESYGWDEISEMLGEAVGRDVRPVRIPGTVYEVAGALSEMMARARGRAPRFDRRRARDLSRHQWTADCSESREALGWEPRVPLPEGARRTAEWYRKAGWI